MSNWEVKRLKDLVDINPETLSTKKYNGKIEYIDISSVNNGQLEKYTTYEISEAPSRARRIIRPNDTIFSTVRPNLKAYYFVKNCPDNAICSTGFAVLRAKKNSNSRFIYSLITENSFIDYLSLVAKGTAYPAVDTSDFLKAKLNVPDLPTQERIADILSSYDDLIENNNRRIELLEKAAQELYKEWFVRFRFPGHEHSKMVNGIPEGWEVKRINEVADTIGGGTPSTNIPEYWENGKIKWITPTDITNNKNTVLISVEKQITELGLSKSSTKLLPENTILMTSRASIGYFGMIEEKVCTNQGFISLIPKNTNTTYYLLLNLMSRKEEIEARATGATFKEISKSSFRKMKIVLPTENVSKQFNQISQHSYTKINRIKQQNQNLKKQRDLLLPRLMSGKLDV